MIDDGNGKVNDMRKCRIQESIRRYLEGLERKKRQAEKRKSGNLFDLERYEPRRRRQVMGPYDTRDNRGNT
jgi:hypothetical protein